jgi:ubiquitin carboxyl-terminal hydrolase 25/28
VRQLRLLFLQLYKSDQAAVRPDEELAYLAITRPEVDQIVAPEVPRPVTPTRESTIIPSLDSIPNIPSPESTQVGTPPQSPTEMDISRPPSPSRSRSVLGKRVSQDREDSSSSRSGEERSRLKSDGFEHVQEVESPMEVEGGSTGEFEMVENVERPGSPSATNEIAALRLKSPIVEESLGTVPPPLPPRLAVVRQATLASGLQFGEPSSKLYAVCC